MVKSRSGAGRPKKLGKTRWRDIGLRLSTIREALDYKDQTAFAKGAKLSQNRYNQYETGARRITLDAALALSNRYEISLDYIFKGDRHGLSQAILSALVADQQKTRKAS